MILRHDLPPEAFEWVGPDVSAREAIATPPLSYWADAWRRFRRNRVALGALVILALMVLGVLFAPYLRPFTFDHIDLSAHNQPPSAQHWFGTDRLGRDLFVRVWIGGRISLEIGLIAAVLSLAIGVIYGGIAAFFGGMVDNIMMRIVEILYGIPFMIVVILLMLVLGSGVMPIVVAFALTGWMGMARVVRGQVLQLRHQEFVLAAETLGASPAALIFRHLIPNTMSQIIINLTLLIPDAIFTEAFLSFVGLGVQPPVASWGSLVSEGRLQLMQYPWQLLFPAILISITILAFNLLGDGLRDALDPRLRQ